MYLKNTLRRVAASAAILLSSLTGAAGAVVSTAAPASAAVNPNYLCYNYAGECYGAVSSLSGGTNGKLYVGQTATITLTSLNWTTGAPSMPLGSHLVLMWGWGNHSANRVACVPNQTTCTAPVTITAADLGQTLEWQGWDYTGPGVLIGQLYCSNFGTAETGTIQVAPPTVSISAKPTSLQVNNWTTVVATGNNVPPGGNINLWSYPNASFTNGTKLGEMKNITASAATYQLPKTDIRQTPQTVWYRATVTGPVNAPQYANVSVNWTSPAPTVSVSAHPTSLTTGSSTTVTASATNVPTTSSLNIFEYPYQGDPNGTYVASCAGNGAATETCSGNDFSNTATTHYYQAFISGVVGSNWASATWNAPPPTQHPNYGSLTLSANPTTLPSGTYASLTASFGGSSLPGGSHINIWRYTSWQTPGFGQPNDGIVGSCAANQTYCPLSDVQYGQSAYQYMAFVAGQGIESNGAVVNWYTVTTNNPNPPPNPTPTPPPPPPPPPVNGSLYLSANPTNVQRPCSFTPPNQFSCSPRVGWPTTLTVSASFEQNGGIGPRPGDQVSVSITGIQATYLNGQPWGSNPLSQVEQWSVGTTVGSCTLNGAQCSFSVPYLPWQGSVQAITFQASDNGVTSNPVTVTWNGDKAFYT